MTTYSLTGDLTIAPVTLTAATATVAEITTKDTVVRFTYSGSVSVSNVNPLTGALVTEGAGTEFMLVKAGQTIQFTRLTTDVTVSARSVDIFGPFSGIKA